MSEIKDKESWHGHTNAEVENYIKNRLDNSAEYHKILYTELKELRDNNKLVPGTQYRITDYICTTTEKNTRSAVNQFDIIVTADSNNVLNENARAIQHEGDKYFANSNLSAWKIWYCLDNDTTRFAWADTVNGKGVIYRMIDEFNNDVPYDFKNILFKVYYDEDFGAYKVGAEDNSEWSYTFCMLDRYDNNAHDVSVEQYKYISDEGIYYHTQENRILPYYDEFANSDAGQPIDKGAYVLNANVFVTNTEQCSVEEDYSYGEFYAFSDNSLKYNCRNNSFGDSVRENIFGNYCSDNAFGCGCSCNSFGNECSFNSFGASCSYNIFGANCSSNSFGNDCYSNVFGSQCCSNILGPLCSFNSFGNDCYHITFASNKSATTKYRYYQHNHFGDGCQYIIFTGVETIDSSHQVQNYNFAQGLQGNASIYLTIDGVRNLSYETKIAKNSNGEIKIYCEADLI